MAKLAQRRTSTGGANRHTLGQFLAPQPAVAERMAAGKALRLEVPRAILGEFRPPQRRKE